MSCRILFACSHDGVTISLSEPETVALVQSLPPPSDTLTPCDFPATDSLLTHQKVFVLYLDGTCEPAVSRVCMCNPSRTDDQSTQLVITPLSQDIRRWEDNPLCSVRNIINANFQGHDVTREIQDAFRSIAEPFFIVPEENLLYSREDQANCIPTLMIIVETSQSEYECMFWQYGTVMMKLQRYIKEDEVVLHTSESNQPYIGFTSSAAVDNVQSGVGHDDIISEPPSSPNQSPKQQIDDDHEGNVESLKKNKEVDKPVVDTDDDESEPPASPYDSPDKPVAEKGDDVHDDKLVQDDDPASPYDSHRDNDQTPKQIDADKPIAEKNGDELKVENKYDDKDDDDDESEPPASPYDSPRDNDQTPKQIESKDDEPNDGKNDDLQGENKAIDKLVQDDDESEPPASPYDSPRDNDQTPKQ
eukprot:PhF_6_TR30423/c0_g1_i8/m.44642